MLEGVLSALKGDVLRAIYRTFASLCALFTVAALGRWGRVTITDLAAGWDELTDGPLVVAYRLLDFFGVPNQWVYGVDDYLAADGARETAIGVGALVLGGAVTFVLSPSMSGSDVPSVQASTWWICAAVVMQCFTFGWLLATPWLVVFLLLSVYRHRKGGRDRWSFDVLNLFVAALAVLLLPLPLVLDRVQPE